MYSKRVRLLVRIIGFLFCTIGLLFISAKILNMSNEGFQAVYEAQCSPINVRDKTYYMCQTDNDAQIKVQNLIDTNNIYSGVCYQTPEGFYTCYTRPSQKTYIESQNIFVEDDPSNDFMPSAIESDILTLCGDYGTTYNKLNSLRVSTIQIGKVIDSSIDIIKGATSQLSNISTQHCITGTTRIDTCKTLNDGIAIFDGLPRWNNGLNYMSSTVSQAVSKMDNISTSLYNTYNGFGYSTCAVVGFPGYRPPFNI